jgi:uncharacterized membrane protein
MRTNTRQLLWIVAGALLVIVVGVVAYNVGVGTGRAGGGMPVVPFRGFGLAFGYGYGLLGWLIPALLIGLVFVLIVGLLPAPRSSPPAGRPAGEDAVDRVRELASLHENGRLTDEEYAAAKRKLLGL